MDDLCAAVGAFRKIRDQGRRPRHMCVRWYPITTPRKHHLTACSAGAFGPNGTLRCVERGRSQRRSDCWSRGNPIGDRRRRATLFAPREMISRSHRVTERHKHKVGTSIVERKRGCGIEVDSKGPSRSQEAGPYLAPSDRNQTEVLAQLRRSPDEGWHHANHLRRVRSPLRGAARTNKKSERGGAPEQAIRA